MVEKIKISESAKSFSSKATYCAGSGKMGLALREEYQQHLEMAQENMDICSFPIKGKEPHLLSNKTTKNIQFQNKKPCI